MAKDNIKGRNVALWLEKTAGSGTYTRFACADDVSLDINTEEIETSACDEDEDGNVTSFKSFEPGDIDWSGAVSGNVRKITDGDVAGNISAEEILDMQLSGRKILLRFSLGNEVGAARYGGTVFFTKNGFSAARSDSAKFSASFRGTGPLTKTLQTA